MKENEYAHMLELELLFLSTLFDVSYKFENIILFLKYNSTIPDSLLNILVLCSIKH